MIEILVMEWDEYYQEKMNENKFKKVFDSVSDRLIMNTINLAPL